MGRSEIDQLIDAAAVRNIEINKITISAAAHDAFIAEIRSTLNYGVNGWRDIGELIYKNVVIHRRKCTGCCAHA